MDCDKFEAHILDALYGEADEVTHAAMRRHGEACAKCASSLAGLRATREVGVLPWVEPPADFEARILEATDRAMADRPLSGAVLRVLSWAGAQARRPELAAAAIFVLVIGSALALLRSPQAAAPRASAEADAVPAAPAALAAGEAPAASPAADPAAEREAAGIAADAEGDSARADAPRARSAAGIAAGPAPGGASARAALESARARRRKEGCKASIDGFEAVASSFPGTTEALEALEEGAACCAQVGQKDRADRMLALAREMAPAEPVAAAPAPLPRAAKAAPAKPAAAPPQKSTLSPPAKAAPSAQSY